VKRPASRREKQCGESQLTHEGAEITAALEHIQAVRARTVIARIVDVEKGGRYGKFAPESHE
jgi:hypothetical protein